LSFQKGDSLQLYHEVLIAQLPMPRKRQKHSTKVKLVDFCASCWSFQDADHLKNYDP